MNKRIEVVPYIHVDGVPTFKDSDILSLWDQMEKEGTLDQVFYGRSVNSRMDFLKKIKSPGICLIVIYFKEKISGIMWANRFQAKFSQWHFCCFRNVWGKHSVIHDMGRIGSNFLLKWLGLDMLMGIIPSVNKRAIKAAVGAGCEIVGTLPFGCYNFNKDKSEPATLLVYTRKEDENEI